MTPNRASTIMSTPTPIAMMLSCPGTDFHQFVGLVGGVENGILTGVSFDEGRALAVHARDARSQCGRYAAARH
jgi:hypothetical protein